MGQRRPHHDVRSQEMAPGIKVIFLRIRHVRVDDGDGEKPRTLVEDLDRELGGSFAEKGADEGAGLDGVAAEGDGHVDDGVEVGEEVGDDVHLCEALDEEEAFVGAPFLEGEVAVDGAVHVAWFDG